VTGTELIIALMETRTALDKRVVVNGNDDFWAHDPTAVEYDSESDVIIISLGRERWVE
jgi:PhoPQ-activated pathogenicity-related protein